MIGIIGWEIIGVLPPVIAIIVLWWLVTTLNEIKRSTKRTADLLERKTEHPL